MKPADSLQLSGYGSQPVYVNISASCCGGGVLQRLPLPVSHQLLDLCPRGFGPVRRGEHEVEQDLGLASFVLCGFDTGAWRSRAEGCWLVVENQDEYRVVPGTVVAVTEGARVVAFFTVIDAR